MEEETRDLCDWSGLRRKIIKICVIGVSTEGI